MFCAKERSILSELIFLVTAVSLIPFYIILIQFPFQLAVQRNKKQEFSFCFPPFILCFHKLMVNLLHCFCSRPFITVSFPNFLKCKVINIFSLYTILLKLFVIQLCFNIIRNANLFHTMSMKQHDRIITEQQNLKIYRVYRCSDLCQVCNIENHPTEHLLDCSGMQNFNLNGKQHFNIWLSSFLKNADFLQTS